MIIHNKNIRPNDVFLGRIPYSTVEKINKRHMPWLDSKYTVTATSNGLLNNLSEHWGFEEATYEPKVGYHNGYTLLAPNNTHATTVTAIIDQALVLINTDEEFLYRGGGNFWTGSAAKAFSVWFAAVSGILSTILVAGRPTLGGERIIVSISDVDGSINLDMNAGNTAKWGSGYDDAVLRHMVMVFPANATTSDVKLYINNNLIPQTSSAGSDTMNIASNYFGIGDHPLTGTYAYVALDEYAFWNGGELTATQVANLYNNGNGLPYSAYEL